MKKEVIKNFYYIEGDGGDVIIFIKTNHKYYEIQGSQYYDQYGKISETLKEGASWEEVEKLIPKDWDCRKIQKEEYENATNNSDEDDREPGD